MRSILNIVSAFLMLIALGSINTVDAQCTSSPYTEDFDSFSTCGTTCGNACPLTGGWTNASGDDFDWTVDANGTTSSGTGPSGDNTSGSGNYLYTETSGTACQTAAAVVLSPCFDISADACPQLSFWYHMFGTTIGTIDVDVSTDGGTNWTNIFTATGNMGDQWNNGTADLTPYIGTDVRFRITGTTGTSFTGDMAIDDFQLLDLATATANFSGLPATMAITDPAVTLVPDFGGGTFSGPGVVGNTFDPSVAGNGTHVVTYTLPANACSPQQQTSATVVVSACGTIATLPFTEDFDSFGTCATTCGAVCPLGNGWTNNSSGDDFDWTVDANGTGSTGTGPSGDNTTGSGNYLYTETSGAACNNSTAIVTSPCIDLSNATCPNLSFAYHLFGAAMGTLDVEITTDFGANWTNIFSVSGDQGDQWNNASIPLTASGTIQIRFVGNAGTTFTSDMAIDDVVVEDLGNNPPDATFSGLMSTVCTSDGPQTLTAVTPGGSYFIVPGGALGGNVFDPAAFGAGTYSITYVVGPTGCTSFSTQTVTVPVPPTIVASTDPTICEGESVNISASSADCPNPTAPSGTGTFGASPNKPIDSAIPTTRDTINVSGLGGTVAPGQLLSVCLEVTHTFTGDLDIFLQCPDGTQLELSTDNDGGDNLTNTCFTQDATANITTGTAPYTGDWLPEGGTLDAFVGCPVDGDWILIITDDAGGDVGTLDMWEITFEQPLGPGECSIQWNTGEFGSSINVSPEMTETFTATVTDDNGCRASDDVTVNVIPAPGVNAGPDVDICAGTCTTLMGSGSASGAIYDVTLPAQTITATGQDFNFSFAGAPVPSGDGTLSVIYAGDFGSTTENITVTMEGAPIGVTNNPSGADCNTVPFVDNFTIPLADLTAAQASGGSIDFIADLSTAVNVLCPLEEVSLQLTYPAGMGGITYLWSTGETTADITVCPTDSMTVYTLTVTDSATGCTNTDEVVVYIPATPDASFSGLLATTCTSEGPFDLTPVTANYGAIDMIDGVFAGPGVTDGTGTGSFDPAAAGAGIHVITYTVGLPGCEATTSQTVEVLPPPTVDAGMDVTACENTEVVLTATSPDCTNPGPPTLYSVSMGPITNQVDGETINFMWNSPPNAAAGASATLTVSVRGDIDIAGSETWEIFDQNGASIGNTNNGPQCSATPTSTDFTISAADLAAFIASGTISFDATAGTGIDADLCTDNDIEMTLTYQTDASGCSIGWNTGSFNPSITVTAELPFTDYIATITDDNGCQASDTVRVNTLPAPPINAGLDQVICENDCAFLDGEGGFGATPPQGALLITELGLGAPDFIELTNVSNAAIDVTGWQVAVNNSYTDINLVNTIVQTLSGTVPPGGTITFADGTLAGATTWGNNILWNPGAYPTFTGWATVTDGSNVVDFVPVNWLASDLAGMNVTIGSFTGNPSTGWTGDGVSGVGAGTGTTPSLSRVGAADNNNAADFVQQASSVNAANPGLALPFTLGPGSPAPGTFFEWSTGGMTDTTTVCSPADLANGDNLIVLTVTDSATGCQAFDTVNVFVNPAPDFTAEVDSVSCFGECNGAIDLTIPGFDPGGADYDVTAPAQEITATGQDFTFNFTGAPTPSGDGTLIVTYSGDFGLASENITLSVEGANIGTTNNPAGADCNTVPFVESFVVPLADLTAAQSGDGQIDILADLSTAVNSFCATEEVIVQLIYPAGPNFTVAWSGPDGFTSTDQDISGLCAGDYDIVITNEVTGCQEFNTVNVPEPDSLIVEACQDTQLVALGYEFEETVLLSNVITGGTPGYTYLWSTGETTSTIQVSPDVADSVYCYSVVVTDFNGCVDSTNHYVRVVDVSCGNSYSNGYWGHCNQDEPCKVEMCKEIPAQSSHSWSGFGFGWGHHHWGSGSSSSSSPAAPQFITVCVRCEDVPKRLADGWTLGSCEAGDDFSGGACGDPVLLSCRCEGDLQQVNVQYNGVSGGTVTVYDSDRYTIIATFSNVSNGDVLAIDASSLGGNFGDYIYVAADDLCLKKISTNCSEDILGQMVSDDFTVVGFVDGTGWVCNNDASDAGDNMAMNGSSSSSHGWGFGFGNWYCSPSSPSCISPKSEASSSHLFSLFSSSSSSSWGWKNLENEGNEGENAPVEEDGKISTIQADPSIAAFPNPNDGKFRVQLFNVEEPIANVAVYDLQGKVVYSKERVDTSMPLEIDITEFPKGAYMVKAIVGEKVLMKQLLKL